jgi:hypothetical protein
LLVKGLLVSANKISRILQFKAIVELFLGGGQLPQDDLIAEVLGGRALLIILDCAVQEGARRLFYSAHDVLCWVSSLLVLLKFAIVYLDYL